MNPKIKFLFIKPLNITLVGLYEEEHFDIIGSIDGRMSTPGIRAMAEDIIAKHNGVYSKDFRI